MGFHTIAIGRSGDKAELAKNLGAHYDIDSGAGAASDALQKLGRRRPDPGHRA